jgi:hypothetical protein
MTRRRSDYGPVQLSVTSLGLELWQFARARQAGLIPCPDRPRNRWSAQVAGAALARAREIRQAAGSIPDVGAVRAAEVLSTRLGAVVTGDGVAELARRGLLPVTGSFKGWPLYDGRALEAFTGTAAAVDATWAGHLRTAGQSAAYLRIRRTDLNHLTRAGLLTPTSWGHGPFDPRDRPSGPPHPSLNFDLHMGADDSPDAVTDDGGEADVRRASNRLNWRRTGELTWPVRPRTVMVAMYGAWAGGQSAADC